jgi:hypothetical protein
MARVMVAAPPSLGASDPTSTHDRPTPLASEPPFAGSVSRVSLTFIVIHGGAGGRGEVDALEQGGWSGGAW